MVGVEFLGNSEQGVGFPMVYTLLAKKKVNAMTVIVSLSSGLNTFRKRRKENGEKSQKREAYEMDIWINSSWDTVCCVDC